jgi:hypothetical protein
MHINLSTNKMLLGLAIICSALLEFIFFESLFQKDVPNGFALFFTQCTIILGMAWACVIIKKRPTRIWYAAACFTLIGALSPFVTSSERGLGLAAGAIVLANVCMFISFLNKKEIPPGGYNMLTWIIVQPAGKMVMSIAHICEQMGNFWHRRSGKEKAAIIGTPLALVTILLLGKINPILEKIIDTIAKILPDLFFAHVFVMAATTLFTFFLFIGASLHETESQTHVPKASHISWDIVLIFLNIPLVIFVVLQLATYIMELTGNTTFSYSLSEYANKGVSQACVATLLCGGVALLAWAKTEKKKKLIPSTITLSLSLIALGLVSESRILAYINEFGFTPARIVGAIGMAALLLAVAIVGGVLVTQKDTQKAWMSFAIIFMISITLTPLLQLDAMSVKLNIARATAEDPFDANQVSDLSIEAYPTFLHALNKGTPMEGMAVNCQDNRGDYSRFLRKINNFINDKEDARWINETAPEMNMENYLLSNDVPEKCN